MGTVMNSFCHLEKSTGAITCCIQSRNCSLHLFIDPDISFFIQFRSDLAGHLLRGGGYRQESGLSGRYAGRNSESVPQKTDELRSIDFAPKSRASALLFL